MVWCYACDEDLEAIYSRVQNWGYKTHLKSFMDESTDGFQKAILANKKEDSKTMENAEE